MKTSLHANYKETERGQEAEKILRTCVHCGFCTATCPTYQELNDERDGPRGRIYLIKQLLETDQATEKTLTHLDRCLTCRSCETTCPSGVEYGHLLDIGREIMEEKVTRSPQEKVMRWGLKQVLPYPARFKALLGLGYAAAPLLPEALKAKLPPRQERSAWPVPKHERRMLVLQGCVQSVTTPNTNAAAARVLDRLGITLTEIPEAGCCGAVNYHLSDTENGKAQMRRNIDAWWPAINDGAEAIIMTASGCGAMVRDYGYVLRNDRLYAEKAATISELTRDLSEILLQENLEQLQGAGEASATRVAVHCPCTLQHAQKLPDSVDQVLARLGFTLTATRDRHLCCGSAGTYSILQPEMSQQLLENKLEALSVDNPDLIVTANIGCQMHLGSASAKPVSHWIELVDEWLA